RDGATRRALAFRVCLLATHVVDQLLGLLRVRGVRRGRGVVAGGLPDARDAPGPAAVHLFSSFGPRRRHRDAVRRSVGLFQPALGRPATAGARGRSLLVRGSLGQLSPAFEARAAVVEGAERDRRGVPFPGYRSGEPADSSEEDGADGIYTILLTRKGRDSAVRGAAG